MAVIALEATTVVQLPIARLTLGLDFRFDDDPDDLAELAISIGDLGVLQALVVRPAAEGWEVIAGRRRLAASRIAGLVEVPCVIRELTDDAAADIALAENLHRRDLSPVEIGLALKRLRDQGLTQAAIAVRVGRSIGTVNALLRLLEISASLRDRVHRRELSYRTALDLAGRRTYTKKASGGSRGEAPPPSGLDADVVTYWRRRHDRLVAGLQRLGRARADGLSLSAVIVLVERLIELDDKPLDQRKDVSR